MAKAEASAMADTRIMAVIHSALRRDLTRAADALSGSPVPATPSAWGRATPPNDDALPPPPSRRRGRVAVAHHAEAQPLSCRARRPDGGGPPRRRAAHRDGNHRSRGVREVRGWSGSAPAENQRSARTARPALGSRGGLHDADRRGYPDCAAMG